MTTLLALDTSTEACSVALWHNGEITHIDELAQRTHTQRILPLIDRILAESQVSLSQVDALVFGRGPGSFTGVRVGAGIAQGLAFGADLPVIPVSNLVAMAQAAYEQLGVTKVLTAIDARMNEVYFAQLVAEKVRSDFGDFLYWREQQVEQVISPEKLVAQCESLDNTWYKVGTGWTAYELLQSINGQSTDIHLPSARYMLCLALPLWQQKQFISAIEIEPVYLRNEVTWKKLPGRE
ncbi:tRNA (adenosine(37)-N6)-threonylcarbamoyltransferase complex dimerization subunit type 1 TsaB [Conservatibacter flavescens]|uniref:tRNA threonylcarbamoyladenosine biosynthesis protein TsaB n=1 Tax=Conservatibacter flavescens TaxID=28161 RepID=A0A2M8S212_9PAST|nr:tRNA (adenosine(37)-N6)-threonylcarbamoyltransferase complex dimerization subunit type 1 TsaB [Conservatibacter flavescens]PJG85192.1 tRNA (adenosine(37)-N6)-threonylcarbamoyltransferase complex dimerization subunit type 1 TsaB [Conservatibacter flavescens]